MEVKRKISILQAKKKLMRQFDQSLLKHASTLGSSSNIEQVYRLSGLAETHFLLVNQYRFTAEDIRALSRFADPLETADQCRRVSGKDILRISNLLDEMNAYMRYQLVESKNQ